MGKLIGMDGNEIVPAKKSFDSGVTLLSIRLNDDGVPGVFLNNEVNFPAGGMIAILQEVIKVLIPMAQEELNKSQIIVANESDLANIEKGPTD